jgi:hypothetical protein
MTDQELLTLAAKAAGLKLDCSRANGGPSPNDGFDVSGNAVLDWHKGTTWNPLTDDGDALRLAVKLRLMLDVTAEGAGAQALNVAWCPEPCGTDPYAATRRAIVRAAAAIGRAMAEKPAQVAPGG